MASSSTSVPTSVMASDIDVKEHLKQVEISSLTIPLLSFGLTKEMGRTYYPPPKTYTGSEAERNAQLQIDIIESQPRICTASAIYRYEMVRDSRPSYHPTLLNGGKKDVIDRDPHLLQTWITDPDAERVWEGGAGEGEYTISLADNKVGLYKTIRISVSREGNTRTMLMVGHCLCCMLKWLLEKLENGLPCAHYQDPEFRDPSSRLESTSPHWKWMECQACLSPVQVYTSTHYSVRECGPWNIWHKLLFPLDGPGSFLDASKAIKASYEGYRGDYANRYIWLSNSFGVGYRVKVHPVDAISKETMNLNRALRNNIMIDNDGLTVTITGAARATIALMEVALAALLSTVLIRVPREDNGAFFAAMVTLLITVWIFAYATLPTVFYPGVSIQDFNAGVFTSKRLDQIEYAVRPWYLRQIWRGFDKKSEGVQAAKFWVYHNVFLAVLEGTVRIMGPYKHLFPVNDNPDATPLQVRDAPPLVSLTNGGDVVFIECHPSRNFSGDEALTISACSYHATDYQLALMPSRHDGWVVAGGSGKKMDFPVKAGTMMGRIISNSHRGMDKDEQRFATDVGRALWTKVVQFFVQDKFYSPVRYQFKDDNAGGRTPRHGSLGLLLHPCTFTADYHAKYTDPDCSFLPIVSTRLLPGPLNFDPSLTVNGPKEDVNDLTQKFDEDIYRVAAGYSTGFMDRPEALPGSSATDSALVVNQNTLYDHSRWRPSKPVLVTPPYRPNVIRRGSQWFSAENAHEFEMVSLNDPNPDLELGSGAVAPSSPLGV